MSDKLEIPVVPTLESGTGVLETLEDKVAYTLRHVISNPGRIYQYLGDLTFTLRSMDQQYEQQPELFATQFQNKLDTLFNDRLAVYSRGEEVNVDCSVERRDSATWDLGITISGQQYKDGVLQPFFDKQMFNMDGDNILRLNLEGMKNE